MKTITLMQTGRRMSNPWFRLYSDFIYDEKIEFISFEDQRHFVFILCMKNLGLLDKEYASSEIFERVVARRLGLFGEAFDSAKKRLIESGLINIDWQPVNWNKRQFVSDNDPTNAERQRKYRERQKKEERNVTRNVTVTVLDTDTDKETEEDKPNTPIPEWLPKELLDDFKSHRKTLKCPMTERSLKLFIREVTKLKDQGCDPVECIETAILNGWKSVYAPKNLPASRNDEWVTK